MNHVLISHGDGCGVYRCILSDDTYDIDACHAPSKCPGCGVVLDLIYDVRLKAVHGNPAPSAGKTGGGER